MIYIIQGWLEDIGVTKSVQFYSITGKPLNFNFHEEKILTIAKIARDLGIKLFVLDDGWFSKRNDDTSSLGD
jgi:hypothetical protein